MITFPTEPMLLSSSSGLCNMTVGEHSDMPKPGHSSHYRYKGEDVVELKGGGPISTQSVVP